MLIKAPGIVKLLGEHAVVYGRLALAAAIDIYANASISDTGVDSLELYLKDFGKAYRFERQLLLEMYDAYTSKEDISSYISAYGQIDIRALPYATIACRLLGELGIETGRKRIVIRSDIPMQSGLASSAACSTAFAVALLKGNDSNDELVIDIARDGERISHANEGAGRIDVSTSYYGGYVSYSVEAGARSEEIKEMPRLLIIDTGPKKSTAETVGHVAELYKSDKDRITAIFDKIDACSKKGIDALKEGNLKVLGRLMLEDQEMLMELGVSSEKLDRAVSISKEMGAMGAKLSGGGGGGVAVAITGEAEERLAEALRAEGFRIIDAKITEKGAASYRY